MMSIIICPAEIFIFGRDKGGMQKWKEPKKTKSVRFPQGAVYLEKRGEERGTL